MFAGLCALLAFNKDTHAQCAYGSPTVAQTIAAPTIVGNTVTSVGLNDNQVVRVTGITAGAVYRVYNCGSGFDTQITIFPSGGGTSEGYNDDNGPECTGAAASINYTPTITGTKDIKLQRYNCSTVGNSNGTVSIRLVSLPSGLPGENCTNAQDLALLTSPYNATTVGYANDISVCRTGYPDRIFFISVPNGAILNIGESTNSYDEYEYLGYGATCPGTNTIYCWDNDGWHK